MKLLKTSTPLEMMLCGFGVSASATVIQAHAVSMFVPCFVTGRLIARFGNRPMIVTGAILNAICVLVALLGKDFLHFTAALVALGVGWNFMFTGATALLAESHSPAERVRARTANDFIVFGTVACTAFSSELLHNISGWNALNTLVLPVLAIALWRVALHRPKAS
jgi:MFS family permease